MGPFTKTTRALERSGLWIGCHRPQFLDPEIRVLKSELINRTEEVLVCEWASICPRLEVVRFSTNTKWLVDRLEGGVLDRLGISSLLLSPMIYCLSVVHVSSYRSRVSIWQVEWDGL